jgi:hypothetical protein
MVEPEMSSPSIPLQVIKDLRLCWGDKFDVISATDNIWLDPWVLKALGVKLSYLADSNEEVCLHSMACGLNMPFFVLMEDGIWRYFLNVSFEGSSDKSSHVESFAWLKKPNGKRRTYLLEKFTEIFVKGSELINLNNPVVQPFEGKFSKRSALNIQNAVALQTGEFSAFLQNEVEIH